MKTELIAVHFIVLFQFAKKKILSISLDVVELNYYSQIRQMSNDDTKDVSSSIEAA